MHWDQRSGVRILQGVCQWMPLGAHDHWKSQPVRIPFFSVVDFRQCLNLAARDLGQSSLVGQSKPRHFGLGDRFFLDDELVQCLGVPQDRSDRS